jgi:hypothetical protein
VNEILDGGAYGAKTRVVELHRKRVRYLVEIAWPDSLDKKNPDREDFTYDRGNDAVATAISKCLRDERGSQTQVC